jgi:hypothetical protein
MKVHRRRNVRRSAFFLAAAFALLFAVLLAHAQQTKSAAPASKGAAQEELAGQVFKNIQSFKGEPASQLIPTMEFMASSLGVECEFCHDVKAFDKDTKEEKRTAREMIAMQQSINRGHFRGQREVTCNTCHHGAQHPAAIPDLPALNAAIPEPAHEHLAHKPPQVAPGQYLDAYFHAAGGEAALAKLTARTVHGTVSLHGGPALGFASFTRANGERATSIAISDGAALSVYDGHTGWLIYPGRHSRQMSAGEAEATRVEADIAFPVNFKQRYPQLRVGRNETIDGKPANLLLASRPGQPPVRLYFDAASHLLVRAVYYVETPLGRLPTQLDITSYTETDGVQLPSHWTITQPASRSIYTMESVASTPIDDRRFEPPKVAEASAH